MFLVFGLDIFPENPGERPGRELGKVEYLLVQNVCKACMYKVNAKIVCIRATYMRRNSSFAKYHFTHSLYGAATSLWDFSTSISVASK